MKYQILLVIAVITFSSVSGIDDTSVITYYGEIGCGHCDLFQEKILPGIEKNAYLGNSALEAGLLDELVFYKKNGDFHPFSSHLSSSTSSISFENYCKHCYWCFPYIKFT